MHLRFWKEDCASNSGVPSLTYVWLPPNGGHSWQVLEFFKICGITMLVMDIVNVSFYLIIKLSQTSTFMFLWMFFYPASQPPPKNWHSGKGMIFLRSRSERSNAAFLVNLAGDTSWKYFAVVLLIFAVLLKCSRWAKQCGKFMNIKRCAKIRLTHSKTPECRPL